MRPGHFFFFIFLGMFLLISASCQGEKEENDYSVVSQLISDRNSARYNAVEKQRQKSKKSKDSKTEAANRPNVSKSSTDSKKEELSAVILYEEGVEILASKSGRTLAKGVAYINKKGQIVRIKILK